MGGCSNWLPSRPAHQAYDGLKIVLVINENLMGKATTSSTFVKANATYENDDDDVINYDWKFINLYKMGALIYKTFVDF